MPEITIAEADETLWVERLEIAPGDVLVVGVTDPRNASRANDAVTHTLRRAGLHHVPVLIVLKNATSFTILHPKDNPETRHMGLDQIENPQDSAANPTSPVQTPGSAPVAQEGPEQSPLRPGYVVFDTETSGLPEYKKPADDPSQPRLAALSMILLDADFNEERRVDLYVYPDGWSMDPEVTAINGLTDDFLRANGKMIDTVLDHYAAAVMEGRSFIAFNAQFDTKIVRGEFRRAGRDDLFERLKQSCLMRGMAAFNKSEGRKGTWPNLEATIAQIGYQRLGQAHHAGSDADAALAVARFLREHGALLEPAVHYARHHPE